eukprot:5825729-Pyramimonas_sp.AAC.1
MQRAAPLVRPERRLAYDPHPKTKAYLHPAPTRASSCDALHEGRRPRGAAVPRLRHGVRYLRTSLTTARGPAPPAPATPATTCFLESNTSHGWMSAVANFGRIGGDGR